jgi:hypothetical protein
MSLTVKGAHDKDLTIPVPLKGAWGSIFKVHCDKLLAGDHLELVSPVVSMTPLKSGQTRPGGMFDPRTKPSWLTMKLRYEGLGHLRDTEYSECFIGECENITMPVKL